MPLALARGLVNRPRLLLLDESLAALDAKLRVWRLEINTAVMILAGAFYYSKHGDSLRSMLLLCSRHANPEAPPYWAFIAPRVRTLRFTDKFGDYRLTAEERCKNPINGTRWSCCRTPARGLRHGSASRATARSSRCLGHSARGRPRYRRGRCARCPAR